MNLPVLPAASFSVAKEPAGRCHPDFLPAVAAAFIGDDGSFLKRKHHLERKKIFTSRSIR
jgi:hypothetical protein